MRLIISRVSVFPKGGVFMGNLNDCVGHYEIKPPIYKKFIEEKQFIRTNGMLKDVVMYLY